MLELQQKLFGLLKISPNQQHSPQPPLHGEILFCAPNVCVHPHLLMTSPPSHHTGFLSLSAKIPTPQENPLNQNTTLLLSWNPAEKTRKSSLATDKSLSFDEKGKISPSTFSLPLGEVNSCEDSDTTIEGDGDESCHGNNIVAFNGRVYRPPKNHANTAFQIDLGDMRSVSAYFRNEKCTNGELVICSHDSVYKILHFHSGGLDLLIKVLHDWKLTCKGVETYVTSLNGLPSNQLHPEEGLYRRVTMEAWQLAVDEFGRVQNSNHVQKCVFFCGVEPSIRREVWPYLLKHHRYDMTVLEKAEMRRNKSGKYEMINAKRENIQQMVDNSNGSANGKDDNSFWRNVICSIEKDVLRTDRSKPFFMGEGNPNLDVLQRILLNYSVYTKTPYTQGMSDLLAPLLIEISDEVDIFWCFVGLMQQTLFISSPSDRDMEQQLQYLRELLRFFLPSFHKHLTTLHNDGAMELLFAHRWVLLCFKREFPENEALQMWEACWVVENFHLLICVAVIGLYGSDVTRFKLQSDEILLHFTHLSMHMNGNLVLQKSRSLLNTLQNLKSVPCTFAHLFPLPATTRVTCHGDVSGCHGDSCLRGGSRDNLFQRKLQVRNFFNKVVK